MNICFEGSEVRKIAKIEEISNTTTTKRGRVAYHDKHKILQASKSLLVS